MTDGFFTPEHDIVEERSGVRVLLAPKGIPMPLSVARARGFVKDQQAAGPSETKAERAPVDETLQPPPLGETPDATRTEDPEQPTKRGRKG